MKTALILLLIFSLGVVVIMGVSLASVLDTNQRLAEAALIQAQTTAVASTSNLIWQILYGFLCLGFLALFGLAIWLWTRNRQLQNQLTEVQLNPAYSKRKWAPGPNAGWRRITPPTGQPLPQQQWQYPYPPNYLPVYMPIPPQPNLYQQGTLDTYDNSSDEPDGNPFTF